MLDVAALGVRLLRGCVAVTVLSVLTYTNAYGEAHDHSGGQNVLVASPETFTQPVPARTEPDTCVLGVFPTVFPQCGEEITVTRPVLQPGPKCEPQSKKVRGVCDCVLGEWPPEPECGEGPVTLTRPILRAATFGGKECPMTTKTVVPKAACECGDPFLSEGEECDGDQFGSHVADIRKSRSIPSEVTVSCSSACTIQVDPFCGDRTIQPGRDEECEGSTFASHLIKPSNVSESRWAAKTCTSKCKVAVPQEPCVQESFVKQVSGCYQLCTKRTCAGLAPSEMCGESMNCDPCQGVKAVQQCTKTGGIVPGNHAVARRVNFFTYGTDGQTVCFSESCLRPNKSFDPNALITLKDGSVKEARDLRATDLLLGRSGRAIAIKQIFESGEEHPLYRLKAGSHSVTVTDKHIVWTSKGLTQARDVRAGDRVSLQNGSIVPLDSVELLPLKLNQKAIGIWTDGDREDDRLIYGGGILVGDYGLEKELGK